MRIASAIRFASLLFALTSACSSKPEDNSERSSEAKDGDRKPAALGTFTCKDVKDQVCVGPTDRFEATAEVIHLIFTTKDLPKNGDVYTVKWVAEDVGQAAPANTVVGTLDLTVSDIVAGTASYTVNGRLKRPTNGWPKGSYRVEVKVGDKVVTSAAFQIE